MRLTDGLIIMGATKTLDLIVHELNPKHDFEGLKYDGSIAEYKLLQMRLVKPIVRGMVGGGFMGMGVEAVVGQFYDTNFDATLSGMAIGMVVSIVYFMRKYEQNYAIKLIERIQAKIGKE